MGDARTSPAWAWGETAVLTVLPIGLGLWLQPADPLWMHAPFPWPVLAPLLCGLRHGFAQGLGSALGLTLGLALAFRLHRLPDESFPGTLAVGLLLTGMLTGEFCDTWSRRMHRLAASEAYQRRRIEDFSRAYHLLRASHAQLERHLAGRLSLRTALERVRRLAARGEPVAADVLDLLAEFVPLSAAALYEVRQGALRELGRLGPEVPAAGDPLVEQALRTGELHGADVDGAFGPVLAAVPLKDSAGVLRGLLAVHDMPLDALQRERLELLALLGGHLGDLLAGQGGEGLERRLGRCLEDARYGLPSVALGLFFPATVPTPLPELVLSQRRALDHAELRAGRGGSCVLMMVMPLTDLSGLDGFVGRLERLLRERYGGGLRELGLRLSQRTLGPQRDPRRLLRELYEECEVDAA